MTAAEIGSGTMTAAETGSETMILEIFLRRYFLSMSEYN